MTPLIVIASLALVTARSSAAAPFVFLRTLRHPGLYAWSGLGTTIVPFGSDVLVGDPAEPPAPGHAGAAYDFDPATGAIVRSFLPPEADLLFGASLTTLGNDVIVGAPGFVGQPAGDGAVHVFDGRTATLRRSFHSPTPGTYPTPTRFGAAVAAAGGTLLVGEPAVGTTGHVYAVDPGSGAVLFILTSPSPSPSDGFGSHVAVLDQLVAVGAPFDDTADVDAGAVYVFDLPSRALLQTIVSPGAGRSGHFGQSLVVSGSYLAAGAPGEGGQGAAYLFDATTRALLRTFANPRPDGSGGLFGTSVAVADTRILVGDPSVGHSDSFGEFLTIGAAYLFDAGTGELLHTFENPTPEDQKGDDEAFGAAVALGGPRLFVADPRDITPSGVGGGVFAYLDASRCGDGVIDPGEICDDGNLVDGDGCDSNCTPTGCGNGVVTAGEQCDDGNPIDGDGCDTNCTFTACGNGVVSPNEQCEDGNTVDGDGCDSNCTFTRCGNGIVTAGEQCDDGNQDNFDRCKNDCTLNVCGDGVINTGVEECDDGNTIDGDGCDSNCTFTGCGNGVVTAGEECDDGNTLSGDDCESDCTVNGGPPQPGIGVTGFTLRRVTPTNGVRPLITAVWYPAAAEGQGPPGGGAHDLPVAAGRFPLVVFSHGQGGAGYLYTQYTQYLARQGFIVAAPDHPFDSFGNLGTSFLERPRDLTFLLDFLLDATTLPSILRDHIDPDRIGVSGHSLGGYTAFAVAINSPFSTRDQRVKAVVGLAPGLTFGPDALATVRIPAMIIGGALDSITPFPFFQQRPYDLLASPKYLVEYTDGSHFVYPDFCASSFCRGGQTNRYAAAFLKEYLADDPSDAALLEPGAEAQFPNIVFSRSPGPALLPGGGNTRDCAVELATQLPDLPTAAAPQRLLCTDGDVCDLDPAPGQCRFDVSLCVNEVDRHLLTCAPRDVVAVRIIGGHGRQDLARLEAAVQAILPTSDRRCSRPTAITVPIPRGRSSGRRVVRTLARGSDGTADVDRFVLTCERR